MRKQPFDCVIALIFPSQAREVNVQAKNKRWVACTTFPLLITRLPPFSLIQRTADDTQVEDEAMRELSGRIYLLPDMPRM